LLSDASTLNQLTDENGNKLGYGNNHSWYQNYQPTSSGSINGASSRAAPAQFLTTQFEPDGVTPDPGNEDGLSTKGGQIGWVLQPLFNFGTTNAYGKCP
jgi:hypothetical protein